MEVKKLDNLSFGNLTKTRELFETILLRNFKSEGTNAIRLVRDDLYPNSPFVGCRGYRYYALKIKDAVIAKYPNIARDYEEIQEYLSKNSQINKKEFAQYMEKYIAKYGENIDINI